MKEEKEFYDPDTVSSTGMSHVPSQHSRIPSPRGMLNRDSGLPHSSRNWMGTSGNVCCETTCTRKNFSVITRNCPETWRRIETRTAQSSTTPTPRFSRNLDAWSSTCRTGGTYSQNCTMETPRYAVSELHFGKLPDPDDFQCWRSISTPKCA